MSVALAKLRKRAAEFEQKKLFDKALEVYILILDEDGKDLGDEDVPLFNRVGDMLMRKGSVTEALGYYERAVDLYAERGFLNNAIALCSKILRQSPGRAAVYYKLGRISARKGFKSDARKNFLEYADRMQKAGQADEAFRALKEFASLYPDQDDVRLVLAELLSKENRKGEALEQLQALYQKLESEGRRAEARATIDRMRAIDPTVTPREGSAAALQHAGDLVFLDLTDEEPRRAATGRSGPQPASARAPVVPSVPALTGLSVTFLPDESEAPRPEGFEATAVAPELTEVPPEPREPTPVEPMLEIERDERESRSSGVDLEAVVPIDVIDGDDASGELELVEDEVRLLDDFVPTSGESAVIVEEVSSPTPEQGGTLSGSEFADLELEETPRQSSHREHDLSLSGELPRTPDEVIVVSAASPASAAAADDARTAAEEAADLEADVAAREVVHQSVAPPVQPPTPRAAPPLEVGTSSEPDEEPGGVFFGAADVDAIDEPAPDTPIRSDVPDDFLALPPSFGEAADTQEHAFPPLFGLDDAAVPASAPDATPEEIAPPLNDRRSPRSTISIGGAEGHLRQRLELEPENWELRRLLGEALLDTGDREGGLYELELAMVGFELDNDIDRAQEVVDEILGVFPTSVRHHQKRVEYAVRSRDRGRLTHSYLELADALFRTGAGDKAVAVYSRVLELDSRNERAEFALATLAPESLAHVRGGPTRPNRWTDELAAIEGPVTQAVPASEDEPAPAERESTVAAAEDVVADIETVEPEAHVPEPAAPDEASPWEAAAELDASEIEPETVSRVVAVPTHHVFEFAVDVEQAVEPAQRVEAPPAPEEDVSAPFVVDEVAVEPELPPAPEEDVSAPLVVDEGAVAPEPAPVTVDAAPVDDHVAQPPEESNGALDHVEEVTVIAEVEPAPPAPRSPTPRAVPMPAESSRLDRAREMTPGAPDSEFVDLGEWLRATEPVRSTRMLVEDPKPTGDEQADFEEMLRRFKRGVAENVEAEDYEAHYDLGVAYKEMGLIDEAIAQFQKSLRGASHRVRSYEALGQCFVERQQYPIAAALLKRATELPGTEDQQLVGVLYLLGFATEHMGRPAEALPYYLRVFAVDIEFRDIAQRVAAMGNAST